MVRVSLKEAYDDRSVIKKIADLEANKQDKLTAGQGVSIDNNTISVDTSDLATKGELTAETARLDTRIDDVDAKIPPLASKEELNQQTARLDARVDAVDAKIPPLASKEELNQQVTRLDGKIDDVDAKIPPLASKAELASEASRLDTKIDTGDRDLSGRIDASNVKIKTNADAIHTIEDELGSDALPGTIYYRIAKVENDVITLKPLVNDSINKVDVEGDASTVYHRALHNSGIVENDALPVASDTKAGVMSAGMYVGFNSSIQNLQARIAVLEGVGITYQLTGLPDNATSEQITAAFREQYPNVPLMAGIRAADYDKAKIWQYSGTSWIQLTSINIDKATSTSLGVVKGSVTSDTNEGKIFVEVDGSMTVIGWDTLKALATAAKQSVDNLEPKVTQQSAKIDALEGDVAANAADITALQGTSANHESRISSLETTSADLRTRMSAAETDIDTLQTSDAQQTSKISSLETTSADLGTRMGTAETDIDTLQASDAQQTSKISALEADMNNVKPRVGQLESDVGTLGTKVDQHTQSISGLSTEVNGLKTKVDQHTQSISGLSTDVNGLKTSKQDKLTAGNNIVIENNVISAVQGSYREIPRADIENELIYFFNNSKAGDTLRFVGSNVNLDYAGCPITHEVLKFGWKGRDSSGRESYFTISPSDVIENIGNYDGQRLFYTQGRLFSKKAGSSEDSQRTGFIYLKKKSDGYWVVTCTTIGGPEYYRNYNTDTFRMVDWSATSETLRGIANYDRK